MGRRIEAIVADTNILTRGLGRVLPEAYILDAIESQLVYVAMSESMKNEAQQVARRLFDRKGFEYARVQSVMGMAIFVPDYSHEVYPVCHRKDYKIVDAAVKTGFPIVSEDEDLTGAAGILQQVCNVTVYCAYDYYMDVVKHLAGR